VRWFVRLCWLLPLLLALAGWWAGARLLVDIGGPGDRDLVRGFYARESNGDVTYRWSSQDAALRLPAAALPAIIEVRGTAAPDGTRLRIVQEDGARVALPPVEGVPHMRRYQFLAPDHHDRLGWTTLHIHAAEQAQHPTDPRAEERHLGLLVAGLTLHPVSGGLHWDLPLPLLASFGLLPLLLAGALRVGGLGHLRSTLLALLAGLLLVALWIWQPLWVQPFVYHMLAGELVLLALLLWLRHGLWPQATAAPARLPWLLLAFVVASGLIPLYTVYRFGLENWLHPNNLPVAAALLALPVPFVAGRLRRGLLAGTGLALLGYGLYTLAGAATTEYATDFTALYRGAHAFLAGEPLYNLADIRFNHLGDTYKYPPFFVFLMGPFSQHGYEWGIAAWNLLNLTLLLLAVFLLWRGSGQPVRAWSTLGLAYLVLAFNPLAETMDNGQADIIILAVLAGALLALRAGRWGVWGALLAFPAMVKLYPAYLLLHALALRSWRGMAGFALGGALFGGLALALLGWPVHATFLFEVLPAIGGGTAWVENQTINGLLNRLATDQIALRPDEAAWVGALTYASALLFSGLTWWRVQGMQPAAGFGLWIVTLLIILPTAWVHYHSLLLIPFSLLLVRLDHADQDDQHDQHDLHEKSNQPAPLDWRTLLLATLAWLLLCYGSTWTFLDFDRSMHGPLWGLLLSYKLYGLLLLWLALAFDPTARTSPAAHTAVNTALQPGLSGGKA
jgi:hypothetical protein